MPFTFSHPAIVLPLKYLPERAISMTALITGSMTPDFEYFIRMRIKSTYSHTWSGLFWYDLPLALVLFFVYQYMVKDKLIAHLPAFFNSRLSVFSGIGIKRDFGRMIVIIICILTGASSHILWDGLTHPSGQFVKTVPVLKHMVHVGQYRLYLFNLLQHLSTFLGGLIVALSMVLLPKQEVTRVDNIGSYWIITIVILALVLFIRFETGLELTQYGDVVVSAISGGFIGLFIASIFTAIPQPDK